MNIIPVQWLKLKTWPQAFVRSSASYVARPVAYPGGVLRVLEHPPKTKECN